MKEMMSVCMHVWKTSFPDVENKNKNCPKIDENEAILISYSLFYVLFTIK